MPMAKRKSSALEMLNSGTTSALVGAPIANKNIVVDFAYAACA
jgi:hypothetical protein